MKLKIKDILAELDYFFDWKPLTHEREGYDSDWLATDETIISNNLEVINHGLIDDSEIITIYDEAEDDGIDTFWLKGGTDGEFYTVSCTIVTNAGRKDTRRMVIKVEER